MEKRLDINELTTIKGGQSVRCIYKSGLIETRHNIKSIEAYTKKAMKMTPDLLRVEPIEVNLVNPKEKYDQSFSLLVHDNTFHPWFEIGKTYSGDFNNEDQSVTVKDMDGFPLVLSYSKMKTIFKTIKIEDNKKEETFTPSDSENLEDMQKSWEDYISNKNLNLDFKDVVKFIERGLNLEADSFFQPYWQLSNGERIYKSELIKLEDSLHDLLSTYLKSNLHNYNSHSPKQYSGEEGDFGILLRNGDHIRAIWVGSKNFKQKSALRKISSFDNHRGSQH